MRQTACHVAAVWLEPGGRLSEHGWGRCSRRPYLLGGQRSSRGKWSLPSLCPPSSAVGLLSLRAPHREYAGGWRCLAQGWPCVGSRPSGRAESRTGRTYPSASPPAPAQVPWGALPAPKCCNSSWRPQLVNNQLPRFSAPPFFLVLPQPGEEVGWRWEEGHLMSLSLVALGPDTPTRRTLERWCVGAAGKTAGYK